MKKFHKIFLFQLKLLNLWASWSPAKGLFVKNKSYEANELVEVVVAKNLEFRKTFQTATLGSENLKVLTALGVVLDQLPHNSKIKVLDFGGGGGHSYWVARNFFPHLDLDWHVVETRSMCEAAVPRLSLKRLRFHTSIDGALQFAGTFDLIFANSAIQYTDNPLETFSELGAAGAKVFFATRTPLSSINSNYDYLQFSIASQNGPGTIIDRKPKLVAYRCTIAPRQDVLKTISNNFSKVDIFFEGAWNGRDKKFGTYTIIARNQH